MPINVENPLAFSFIMQDDIFLLADDRAGFKKPVTNPAEVESTPLLTTVPEAEPISRPDPVNFSYYGGNKKNFLVIVHYPGHELMDESHFTALESTLSRLGFNTDDVAILNRAKYADTAITVLEEYFRPQKLLLMGKDSLAYGLAAPEPNKINNSSGYPVLYTFSFAGMMNSSENKKVFLGTGKAIVIMHRLVFATNNKHKLEEVAAKLNGSFKLLSLDDIGCTADIAETGLTFRENAALKSSFIYNNYHLNCFGDDSGLEIDALNGEPGVYSARYASRHGDHEANMDKVLAALGNHENRNARFKTVISLMWNGDTYFFDGTVEGTIRKERAGVAGFGYDPIFQPDGYTVTFAEMSMEEKNQISHRAIAVEKLIAFFSTIENADVEI